MEKTKVSVMMSVYNTSKYLRECIESVLSQDFSDFEFIIVNDGSTDNSIDIIKSYTDKRIVLIDNQHSFIDSLNKGMSAAQGKYIARMDSDDIMMPDRLKIQYQYLESNLDIDVCDGGMQMFGLRENKFSRDTEHKSHIIRELSTSPLYNATTMLRSEIRELFEIKNSIYQVYKTGYTCAEDYKMWIDLICKGCHFKSLPVFLHKYRIYESQSTATLAHEMMISSNLTIQIFN